MKKNTVSEARRREIAEARRQNVGKPKFIFTDEMINELRILSAKGLNIKQICGYFGIAPHTFRRKVRENPALKVALDRGRAQGVIKATNQLSQQIDAGNLGAITFYLERKGGWVKDMPEDDIDDDISNDKIGDVDPIEAARIYQQIMRGDKK